MNGCTNEWTERQMVGWMVGRMDGCINGWMDKWMGRCMDESSLQRMMASRLHLPLCPNLCIPERHVELNMKFQGQKQRGGKGREGTDGTKPEELRCAGF